MIKNRNLFRITTSLWILYILMSFIFLETVFSSEIIRYIWVVLMVGFSLYIIIRKSINKIDKHIILWIPFILWQFLGYFLMLNINRSFLWLFCLFMLIICQEIDINDCLSAKLFVALGVFAALGIVVQIVFPTFYYGYICPLFSTSNSIVGWSYHTGYAGFTYQLAMTAAILIPAEGACLYLFNKSRKPILLIIAAAFFYFVLLTGKRTMSFAALVAPVFVFLISPKEYSKRINRFIYLALGLLASFAVLYLLLPFLPQKGIVYRISETINTLLTGEDVSSGRNELFAMGIELFQKKPIFGAGIGGFISSTSSDKAIHNSYLQVLCEQGLIGELCFLIPVFSSLIYTIILTRRTGSGPLKFSLFIQIYFVIYSFTGNTVMDAYGFGLYFIAIAILISARCSKKEGLKNEENRNFDISFCN